MENRDDSEYGKLALRGGLPAVTLSFSPVAGGAPDLPADDLESKKFLPDGTVRAIMS